MIPYKKIASPNCNRTPIEAEFVVLHYTAGSLQRALDLLTDSRTQVSAHLVIGRDGELIELVRCLDGVPYRAWHAGQSRWYDGKHQWEGFNDFSIGIELVNPNGNLFDYTPQQYDSLVEALDNLQQLYPSLRSAERILGHEQIAGWRGKADPGFLFDWAYLYDTCYPGQVRPERESTCSSDLKSSLEGLLPFAPAEEPLAAEFWHALSQITETCVRLSASGD